MFKSAALASFAALSVVALSAPALADDPNDPTMRSAAARAKDKARIRQMNLDELERVRKRDAAYAEQWRAYREYYGDNPPAQPRRACRTNRQGRCIN